MEDKVIKVNEGLSERVTALQAQVGKLQKMLDLCLQVISEFGHFIPSIIEDFKYELKKLDAVDTVEGDPDDQPGENITNLGEDGVTAS